MNHITTAEAAEKWNISPTRITILAKSGRIPGAIKMGNSWLIPENAQKPTDNRTKKSKAETKERFFRFPLYVNFSKIDYVPPLSAEEKKLRQAQLDFLACDFEKAEKMFLELWQSSENIYVRISAVFFLCWLSVSFNSGRDYKLYYTHFELELSNDFPRKKETELFRPLLFACMSRFEKVSENFGIDPEYEYPSSVYPLMAYLSFNDKESVKNPAIICNRAEAFDILARQSEKDGYFFEAYLIRLALFFSYYLKLNKKTMTVHLKKAVDIAYKHNFIIHIADLYPFYKNFFDKVFEDYPREFSDRIKNYATVIEKSYSEFTKNQNITDIYSLLSNNDFKYIMYAVENYSNKQVADILHISQRTVANKYKVIYEKLNIDNKHDLIEIMKKALK